MKRTWVIMLLGMAVPVAASGKDSLEEYMRMPADKIVDSRALGASGAFAGMDAFPPLARKPLLLADAGEGHAHPPEKTLEPDTASEHTEDETNKKEKETEKDGEKSPSKEDHETKNNAEEHDKKAKRRDHRRRHGKGRKR